MGIKNISTGIEVFGAEAITWIQQERIQSE